jgi:hypothetical protein
VNPSPRSKDQDTTTPELLIDFISSLDGYAAAEGWSGRRGLEGSEYGARLGEQPEADYSIAPRQIGHRRALEYLRHALKALFHEPQVHQH